MESNKLNIASRDILRHFSWFILGWSRQTIGFMPLSYLIICLNEGLIEIKPNNGDRKSENVIFLASDVLFISTSGAFGVGVVLVSATKIFFCSSMIEYNATEHFHVDLPCKKTSTQAFDRHQIDIFILKLRCFIHYALKLVISTRSWIFHRYDV